MWWVYNFVNNIYHILIYDISKIYIIYKFIASFLQPWQFYTKITSEKVDTLMEGGFL